VKKILFFIMTGILLLSGCQTEPQEKTKIEKQDKIFAFQPSSEDVVNKHGNIENVERFIIFLDNVKAGKRDKIRVVGYTEEGDPMLHDIEYDGELLHSTTDTRRDKYGSGKIDSTTCKEIEVEEKDERTDYTLSGCERINRDNSILVIWK
jgi:hypothetical protein